MSDEHSVLEDGEEERRRIVIGHINAMDFRRLADRHFSKEVTRCWGGRIVLNRGDCLHCQSTAPKDNCREPMDVAAAKTHAAFDAEYEKVEQKRRDDKPLHPFRVRIFVPSWGHALIFDVEAIDERDAGRLALRQLRAEDPKAHSEATAIGQLGQAVEITASRIQDANIPA